MTATTLTPHEIATQIMLLWSPDKSKDYQDLRDNIAAAIAAAEQRGLERAWQKCKQRAVEHEAIESGLTSVSCAAVSERDMLREANACAAAIQALMVEP